MGFHWTCTLDFPTEDLIIANRTEAIRQLYEDQFVSKDNALEVQKKGEGNGEVDAGGKKDI